MTKLDLKKDEKQFYNPSKKDVETVDVPPMNFLMIDGQGDPNTTQAYQDALEALYTVSFGVKFASKKEAGVDYVVLPLEGLWWAEDMATFDVKRDKSAWKWTMMIRQPDHLTGEVIQAAIDETARKKNPVALGHLRFEPYHEGLAVQIMHIGPFDAEGPTIARLHEFIESNGYLIEGKHHEIYLSDPRRAAPEKMRTVIRQPMRKAVS